MDHEVTYDFEDEEQFWIVLDQTVSRHCDSHSSIDDTLRSYLSLVCSCRDRFLPTDEHLGRCAFRLQESTLFEIHADYIRRQFVHCLLEEDEHDVILASTSFLLADAQSHEGTFELLNDEGAFPRLVDLISSPKQHGNEVLHRLLMELLYEMARIQKIRLSDLAHVSDDFIKMLFEIIEQVSDDVNDPYHYPTIRVLLVLNEQYMVAAHDPANGQNAAPLTNRVIKVLSTHGSEYKTFGENIILLLNREDETSLQLLTLKLLYLLFTTPTTYEYFYTNDLHVMVDILLRNLLDLPEEASSLRHTYLRVLYPLLQHTQLQYPPYYKREEIRKVLMILGGGHARNGNDSSDEVHPWTHFDVVDETTSRLVKRCEGVSWLTDPEIDNPTPTESPTDETASNASPPSSPSKGKPPALPAPRKLKKRTSSKSSTLDMGQYLTPQSASARQSSLSMIEVAAQREKPGVMTPSRNPSLKQNLRAAIMHKKERPPPPPQARRSGWGRPHARTFQTDMEVAKAGITVARLEVDPETERQPNDHDKQSSQPRTSVAQEKEKKKTPSSQAPPPVPSRHKGHFKKPPPAPKARRWRVGRGKQEDGNNGSNEPRQPGKFGSNLPSIVTTSTTGKNTPEPNPFSPHEKESSETTRTADSNMKMAVSQALENAQAQVVEAITDTLEHVDLHASNTGDAEKNNNDNNDAGLKEPSQEADGTQTIDSTAETSVSIEQLRSRSHSRTGGDVEPSYHDAVMNQPQPDTEQSLALSPSRTPSSSDPPPPSQQLANPNEVEVMADPEPESGVWVPISNNPPRMVLTPPAQEPLRGVPGPQYELERSPFLTDEEEEEEEEDEEDDHDHDHDHDLKGAVGVGAGVGFEVEIVSEGEQGAFHVDLAEREDDG
ncbi:hypothetical protein A1O1_03105 [Capronia coronata CBS 617.96]|uniref:SPIN90/Ldb17 leucine-rich domain-containing protein n=1 Tax=Capronia coronata CBS 617.96 TaxID=1182541 RepID=W9YQ67_9EURO|nr:uncharacterized protein A1O1_03105 [Capronia coronata CBS 617.96]EXJ94708.1 hypothetical protein A1O1_03105 [Capronia coronata CBS 617.96]